VPVRGFESRKALALICYLAVQGRAIPRGELAALFWGDKPEVQSRANLSRVLHNNAELLPECLQIDRDSVQLIQSDLCRVDVADFLQLTAHDEVATLVSAARLYQGDLMQDCSLHNCPEFETWLLTQQEIWRQRVARVLKRLIDIHYDRGEYEQGLVFASQLVNLDPWREEAHRLMMLMLALSGQRITALLQYKTCCRILSNELGVSPCEETTALNNRIQSGLVGQKSISTAQRVFNTAAPWPPLSAPVAVAEGELDAQPILARLDDHACRLLTLVGQDGEQAIQLALQVIEERRPSFRDGVYRVPLATSGSNGTFLATIADALNLAAGAQTSLRVRLLNYLRDKELLLVLTDFDPVYGQTVLLEDILKRAPHVKIVVTSYKPLNLSAEWIYDV
jgi:DNA-binding SARP family transcriptional activator